ncbi:NAD-dependent formate dehydrogenase flavoprotein subunit [Palleronia marisminoris]|uniref:NADP-reducing hydrogenase subunit HndC n=1 Tax=Palleronia marisminoris TaxID=315423 RepID=A0A1Y5SBK9_9RHOB|nr:NAD(P)H-dependent oxidoreductase subunit E [Palleronia marisminoris]SFG72432.1 NAD-dependent formate dehydrogenase flavoprotein subunit [Palleronia marisminoris]SLN37048.1 NADP-reducing hydrogenase subunit HndC [Palleronia marisminoris]
MAEAVAKRPRATPKGRQTDPEALLEVEAVLGPEVASRDRLIEELHRLQEHFGHLSARHLRALAERMRLAQAEIFEVATFYHHFDVVKEGEPAPAPLTLRVCDSISCMLEGAEALLSELGAQLDPAEVRIVRAPCMGRCDQAPVARVGDREVDKATPDGIADLIARQDLGPLQHDYIDLRAYRERGGYALLERMRTGEHAIDDFLDTMEAAGLRGLGGAGFPLATKWRAVRQQPHPRLMTVNADEGEPGTFKDRLLLETDPHRMLEGALIAAHAVEAERLYIYMRDEYPAALGILRTEIAALEASGIAPHGFVELRRGAGAYICGEESAMVESLEGKRGYPRNRPPYIAQKGLFGRPTLNHNVETLWWLRDIAENGAEWFAKQGRRGAKGLRSFSVSGRVRKPGVRTAPAGITVRELIDEYCGGMADGHEFRAYLPGGASGGLLPARLGDVPLDFGGELAEQGAFIGSHAVVIFSDKDDMREVVKNLMRFFRHESCGQCTPCREGTGKMLSLISADRIDREAIADLEQVMRDASICGLGQAAPNPVRHLLDLFPEDTP